MPNSGSAPYVYAITFENSLLIDGVNYVLEGRSRSEAGLCPPFVSSGARNTSVETELLSNGIYSTGTNVPLGSCSSISVLIREVATGLIISQSYASVSNIE